MNEKLQYATMLEIPVNTVSVTVAPQKKRHAKKKKVDHDSVKQELLNKVNSEILVKNESEELQREEQVEEQVPQQIEYSESTEEFYQQETALVTKAEKKKKRFKFSVVGVQMIVIGALIATIFLTNALYSDSGINVFLREVFGTQTVAQADLREYDEFVPVIAVDDGATATYADGVITVSGRGSVYAGCDGKVSKIEKGEDGKYTIEITHSQNFKSILGGLDYAYAGLDDSVYHNIPVGFVNSGATMCFQNNEGTVISDYQIIDNQVVWAV